MRVRTRTGSDQLSAWLRANDVLLRCLLAVRFAFGLHQMEPCPIMGRGPALSSDRSFSDIIGSCASHFTFLGFPLSLAVRRPPVFRLLTQRTKRRPRSQTNNNNNSNLEASKRVRSACPTIMRRCRRARPFRHPLKGTVTPPSSNELRDEGSTTPRRHRQTQRRNAKKNDDDGIGPAGCDTRHGKPEIGGCVYAR